MHSAKPQTLMLSVILIGVFWTKAATLISMPFLTLFLFKNTQLSIVTIGLIVGMQPLALCFGSIVGGYFSDIFKRHTVMLFSVFSSSIIYFGFYCVSKYITHEIQIISFAVLNLLNGFCSALFAPVSNAIISDLAKTPQENIKFLHMRYLVLNLGATIGPLMGAYAGIAASNQAFILTMLFYFVYGIILFSSIKSSHLLQQNPSREARVGFLQALKTVVYNRWFIILAISLIFFNMLYIQLSSNLALLINQDIEHGVIFFSWMLSLSAIMVVVLQPIIYLIIKNRDQRLILIWGYLIILICSLILAFTPISKLTIVAFVICLTMAEIIVFPTSYVLVAEFADKNYLGVAYGAIDFTYLGSAIGPVIGGLVIEHYTGSSFFVLMTLLAFLSLIVYAPLVLYFSIVFN